MTARTSTHDAIPNGTGLRDSREPYTRVHALVRHTIETVQDVLVVSLAIVLFGVMVRTLVALGSDVLGERLSFGAITSQALFIFVLIELQRLLILYLRDHHVSIDVMVEVTLVAVLRETLLLGAAHIEPLRLLTLTAFLLVLGALLRFGDLRRSRRRFLHAKAPRSVGEEAQGRSPN